jgi:hypothetical protein
VVSAEAHFYDGDNKLRLFNRHNGIDVNSVSGSNWLHKEYRYDALGRRVWRRTQGGQLIMISSLTALYQVTGQPRMLRNSELRNGVPISMALPRISTLSVWAT